MGIKDLSKFLRDRNVNCFVKDYPLSNLQGYRIGIDANNFLFVYGAGVHKDAVYQNKGGEIDRAVILQKLYERVLHFLMICMNSGVTPIMVFDGKAEAEKNAEREKRREDRAKRQSKIKELKEEVDKTPIHLRNVKNLGNVPKEMWEEAMAYAEKEKELKKMLSTQVTVQYDEIDAIKELLDNLGIPCIRAEAEGEMCCAELAIVGETAATFSTDSDCLPLGINFYFDSITGSQKRRGGYINGVLLKPVLEELKLNMNEFRDFCILLGTDFNDRIPGYGPAKGYQLIQECRDIETIASKKGLDITNLNHIRTRELITPKIKDWSDHKLDIDFSLFETYGYTVLEQYGLQFLHSELKDSVDFVKKVRHDVS
jgi:flap endonuclease-1